MSDRIETNGTDQETVASLNRLIDAVMSSLKGTTGKPWVGTIHALADQLAMDGWTRSYAVADSDDSDEPRVAPWSPLPYHRGHGCTMNLQDGMHEPGRTRGDWDMCVNCDEWPYQERRPDEDSTRAEVNDLNRVYVRSLRRSADLIERSIERGDSQSESNETTWRGDRV